MKYSILVTAKKLSELENLFKSIEKMEFDKREFEVVATYEREDATISPSFKLVKKKIMKKGIAAGRNAGIEIASGNVFVFTDADCAVPKNWLKILDRYVPKYDVVAGNAKIFYKTKFGKIVSFIGYPAGGNLGFEKVFPVENGFATQLSTCNAAIKADIAKKLKFDEKLVGGEDKDISIRLIENGYKIKYAADWYIFHPSKNYINEYAKWMFNRGKHAYFFVKKHKKSRKNWKRHFTSIISLPFPFSLAVFIVFITGLVFQFLGYANCAIKKINK